MFNKSFFKIVAFVLYGGLLLGSCQSNFQNIQKARAKNLEIVKINTELGISYMQNQQYDDAEEKLTKAIKKDPRNPDALNAMALLKSRTNQTKLADYYFRKALKSEPDNPLLNNNYGQYLCTNGSYTKGLNFLEKAAIKYEKNTAAIAFFNSGICAKMMGDFDMAISYMKKAINRSPNYKSPIVELSSLMIKKQDYQQAANLLERFNELSTPTALSLYTGYLISKKKGEINESKRLRILLKNLFPFSKENIELTKLSQ